MLFALSVEGEKSGCAERCLLASSQQRASTSGHEKWSHFEPAVDGCHSNFWTQLMVDYDKSSHL